MGGTVRIHKGAQSNSEVPKAAHLGELSGTGEAVWPAVEEVVLETAA